MANGVGGFGRAPPFMSLRLALLGIRWRRWASVATLVVAILAASAAMLGPMYAAGADDSLVRQRIVEVPATTTSIERRASKADNFGMSPADLLATVSIEADDPGFTPGYGPVQLALLRDQIVVASSTTGKTIGLAPVAWRDGQCTGVPISEGACPTGADQVMISQRLAEDASCRVGDTVVGGDHGRKPADHELHGGRHLRPGSARPAGLHHGHAGHCGGARRPRQRSADPRRAARGSRHRRSARRGR